MPQLKCPSPENLFDIDVEKTTQLQDLYLELEGRIKIHINILEENRRQAWPGPSSKINLKIHLINSTLHLLRRAIHIKENINEYIDLQNNPEAGDINLAAVNQCPFNNMDDLLDYKPDWWSPQELKYVSKPSLREALNISRNAAFLYEALIDCIPFYYRSKSISFFQPLWGKTTTLDNFEKTLLEEFDLATYKQSRRPIAQNETVLLINYQNTIRNQEERERAASQAKYANDRRGGPGNR